MPAYSTALVSLEIYCILVSLVLIYGLAVEKKQKTTLVFLGVILSNIIGLVTDLMYWVFDSVPGKGVTTLLRITDYINHVTVFLLVISLVEFLRIYMESKGVVLADGRTRVRTVGVVSVGIIFFTTIAQWNELYSYFDENNRYYPTDLYWIAIAVAMISIILYIWCMLGYWKYFDRRERISFFTVYVVFPISSVVLQLIDPNLTLAYLCGNAVLLVLYANIYNVQAKELQNKEMQIAQNKIMGMLWQMKPEFLYDSLSAIEGLCLTNAAEAKRSVLNFTNHLRARLDAIVLHELLPFEEAVEQVRSYLMLEEMRIGKPVHVRYDIGAMDFMLPTLTIQSVVEGLVKAGQGCLDITISSYEAEQAYYVEIQPDAYVFTEADASLLAMIHDGVSTLCGGSVTLAISGPDKECVVFRVPKQAMQLDRLEMEVQ